MNFQDYINCVKFLDSLYSTEYKGNVLFRSYQFEANTNSVFFKLYDKNLNREYEICVKVSRVKKYFGGNENES